MQSKEEILSLSKELKNADINDQKLFHKLVSRSCELLDIKDDEVAKRFGTSRSTIKRWKNGINAPHPAMRRPVYAWLLLQCTHKI